MTEESLLASESEYTEEETDEGVEHADGSKEQAKKKKKRKVGPFPGRARLVAIDRAGADYARPWRHSAEEEEEQC